MGFMNFLEKYEKKINIVTEEAIEPSKKVKKETIVKETVRDDNHVCVCKFCNKQLSEKTIINTVIDKKPSPVVSEVKPIDGIKSHASSILEGVEEQNTEAVPLTNQQIVEANNQPQQTVLSPEMVESFIKNGQSSETTNHASLLV